jgi:hypothetical protein
MLLATASRSGVKVLTSSNEDATTLSALGKAFRAHAGVVAGVDWHADQLASAGHDGSVAVCTALGVPTRKLVPAGVARTPLACVAATATLVVAGAADGAVHTWQTGVGGGDVDVATVALPSIRGVGAVGAVAIGGDELVAAVRAGGGGVALHRVGASDAIGTNRFDDDVDNGIGTVCNVVRFGVRRPELLAAGSVAGDLLLWSHAVDSALSATPPTRIAACHRAALTGLAFSPANRQLLCSGGLDRRLVFCDVDQRAVVREIATAAAVAAVAFRADGFTVAAGTNTGSVLIYDLRGTTDAPLAKLATHSPFACHALAFRAAVVDDSAFIAELQAAAPVVTPVGTGAPATAVTTAGARRVVALGSTAAAAATVTTAAAAPAAALPVAPRTAVALRPTKATSMPVAPAAIAAASPARTPAAAAPQAPPTTVRTVRISLKHNEVIGVARRRDGDDDNDGGGDDDEHSPIGTPLGAALVTPVAPRTGNDATEQQSAPTTAEVLNRRLLDTPPAATRRLGDDDESLRAAVDEARQLLHRDMVDLHHAMIQNFSQLFDAQVVALRTLQQQNNVLLGEVVALRAQVQHLSNSQQQRQPTRKQPKATLKPASVYE